MSYQIPVWGTRSSTHCLEEVQEEEDLCNHRNHLFFCSEEEVKVHLLGHTSVDSWSNEGEQGEVPFDLSGNLLMLDRKEEVRVHLEVLGRNL